MPKTEDKGLPDDLSKLNPDAFGYEQARHLLWRAGFGGTPRQIQTLASWGIERAVDHLVDYTDVSYTSDETEEFDPAIIRPPSAEEREAYRRARARQDENFIARIRVEREQRERADRRQIREVQRWWLKRMIESPRPLEEKLTLFWHGHFATSYRTIEDSYHMYMQNRLFRRHATGSYADLLYAIIRDPAMIAYLDNNDSRVGRPNENLARELMELFSLGVGNYTEADIKEGARALTGYTFQDDQFTLVERNHDKGDKRILGEQGNLHGDDFVTAILRQRTCPEFITRKLYAYFVADLPDDDSLIDTPTKRVLRDLANTFQRNRYTTGPTLKKLFLSAHFYSPSIMNEQIKSPTQLIVGAVRSLNTPVRDLATLLDAMDLMGQHILYPPSVKGWPGGRTWINTSTLFVRQNALAFLLTGKRPRGYDAAADIEQYSPTHLLDALAQADPGAERDPDRVARYLLNFAIGNDPAHARQTLRDFAAEHDDRVTPDLVTGMLLLITAMPEYQLC